MTSPPQGATEFAAAADNMSAQRDHESAFQHFYRWWYSDEGSSGPSNNRFVPLENLTRYFGATNYRRLFNTLHALFPSGIPPSIHAPTIVRDYIRVYAVLLSIGRGAYIVHFLRYQLADQKLPLEVRPPSFPRTSRAEDDFWISFYDRQWMVSPVTMHNLSEVCLVREAVLPILTKEWISEGGASVTYKIEIHPRYNSLHEHDSADFQSSSSQSNCFVLKTYGRHKFDLQHHHHERDAYIHLRNEKRRVRGLIGFYGSFIHGDEHNIILEYADRGTLEDFLQGVEPATEDDIFRVWNGVFGILEGLVRLHEILPSKESGQTHILQGWHQDVNPSNILAKTGGTASKYDCEFALADLGLSHFKKDKGDDVEDGDTHGTREYGAPECYRRDEFDDQSLFRVTNKVDVWSLGAVLSEVATWVVSRTDGLEQYRRERQRITGEIKDFRDIRCFHDGSRVLPFITKDHHPTLRHRARGCDQITPEALNIIDDMLFPSSDRPPATYFRTRAARLLRDMDPSTRQQRSPPVTPPTSAGSSRATPFSSPGESQMRGSGQATDLTAAGSPIHHQHRVIQGHFEDSALAENYGYGKTHGAPQLKEASVSDPAPALQDSFVNPRNSQPSLPSRDDLAGANMLPSRTQTWSGVSSIAYLGSQPTGITVGDPSTYPESGNKSGSTFPPAPGPSGLATTEWPQLSVSEASKWLQEYKANKDLPLPNDNWRNELKGRDTVFVIDDSVSMRPYWSDVAEILRILGFLTKKMDDDGVDIYFMNSNEKRKKVKHSTTLINLAENNEPKKNPHLRANFDHALQSRLTEYVEDLQNATRQRNVPNRLFRRSTTSVRPLSLYIFTDGVWQSRSNPVNQIVNLIQDLRDLGKPETQVGIQFIQFGNDWKGQSRLEYLDSKLTKRFALDWDIIDTEPSTGNVWKMLLGAINKTIDNDKRDGGDPIAWYHLFGIDVNSLTRISSGASNVA